METDDSEPRDMDELFVRGTQSVRESSVLGQAAGLGGLGAVFVGTVSLLTAGAIVAVGIVAGVASVLLTAFVFAG